MAKPEWGRKRICYSCGSVFYDLGRDPIVCPKCDAEFDPEAILKSRRGRVAVVEEAKAKPSAPDTTEADEVKDKESATEDKESATEDKESATEDKESAAEDEESATEDKEAAAEDEDDVAEEEGTDLDKADALIEDPSGLTKDEDDVAEAREHLEEDNDDKAE